MGMMADADTTDPTPANAEPVDADAALDRLLREVVAAHPDRVEGWICNEPGQWGFLAGQAVLAVRRLIGRRLTDGERRWVWHRMWQTLEGERGRQFGN